MDNKSGKNKNSILGIVGIIVIVITMIFSAYLLARGMEHICCEHQKTEAGCPECAQIIEYQNILQRTSVKVFVFVALLSVFIFTKAPVIFSEVSLDSTLVAQKVRIDD